MRRTPSSANAIVPKTTTATIERASDGAAHQWRSSAPDRPEERRRQEDPRQMIQHEQKRAAQEPRLDAVDERNRRPSAPRAVSPPAARAATSGRPREGQAAWRRMLATLCNNVLRTSARSSSIGIVVDRRALDRGNVQLARHARSGRRRAMGPGAERLSAPRRPDSQSRGDRQRRGKLRIEHLRGGREGARQRRADLAPSRAKRRQQSAGFREVRRRAGHARLGALAPAGGRGELSAAQSDRELPNAASAARRHRKPHRVRAQEVQRRRSRLQHQARHDSDGHDRRNVRQPLQREAVLPGAARCGEGAGR